MLDSWLSTVGAVLVLAAFVWLRPHALDPLDTSPTQSQVIGEGIGVPKPEGPLASPIAENTDSPSSLHSPVTQLQATGEGFGVPTPEGGVPSPLPLPPAEETDSDSGLHSPPTQPQVPGEGIDVPTLNGVLSPLGAPLAENTESHSGLHSPPTQPQAPGEGIDVPTLDGVLSPLAAPLAENTDSHFGSYPPPPELSADPLQLTIPTRTRREGRRPLPPPPRGPSVRRPSVRSPSVQKSSLNTLSDSAAFDDIALLGNSSTRVSHRVRLRTTGALYVRKSMTPRDLPIHDIVRELKRMEEVHHPNIVKCFSVSAASDVAHEVTVMMEYCEGGNLESARNAIQARGAVPGWRVVGRIAEGILRGLAHLHGMTIIHRDIKPTNILFSGQGVVKLSEFAVAGDSVGAIGDTFMGSLVYTAPERISGRGFSVGIDIWAMGISLLEFVHRECPYPPDLTPIEMLLRIGNGEPPRLKDCDGVIWSEDMKDFFQTVLRVDPETRPNTHELLGHPWMASVMNQEVDMERWMRQVGMGRAINGYVTRV